VTTERGRHAARERLAEPRSSAALGRSASWRSTTRPPPRERPALRARANSCSRPLKRGGSSPRCALGRDQATTLPSPRAARRRRKTPSSFVLPAPRGARDRALRRDRLRRAGSRPLATDVVAQGSPVGVSVRIAGRLRGGHPPPRAAPASIAHNTSRRTTRRQASPTTSCSRSALRRPRERLLGVARASTTSSWPATRFASRARRACRGTARRADGPRARLALPAIAIFSSIRPRLKRASPPGSRHPRDGPGGLFSRGSTRRTQDSSRRLRAGSDGRRKVFPMLSSSAQTAASRVPCATRRARRARAGARPFGCPRVQLALRPVGPLVCPGAPASARTSVVSLQATSPMRDDGTGARCRARAPSRSPSGRAGSSRSGSGIRWDRWFSNVTDRRGCRRGQPAPVADRSGEASASALAEVTDRRDTGQRGHRCCAPSCRREVLSRSRTR
jgi:hypothetical protein